MANFKTRIKQKNDTTANWNTANATGFKPLQGEIIVYNDVNRIKIGDGTNTVSNVPFLDANCVHLTGTETIDGYKTFKKYVTIEGGGVENADIMLSATNAANNPGMAGEITWHDGEGNDGAVYIPQGQGETLAMCYQLQGKHFQPFAVGDDLSGQTLYFNNQAVFGTYFQAQYTILTSSGGYSVAVGGPPNINLAKNGTHVATFYNFSNSTWLESYTLPSDFGNIETLDTKGGSDGYDAHKSSIWYTLGLGPVEDYTTIDVEDVYNDIRAVEGKIPSVLDSLYNSSTTDALSANQGRLLNLNKAPNSHASSATTYGVGTTANYGHVKLVTGDMNGKANADGQVPSLNHTHSQYAPEASPTFTGTVTLSGTTTPLSVNSTVGAAGQVLTSQGMGKSPTWKDISTPSNMVTTDTNQTITGYKTFQGGIELNGCSAVFANVANSNSPNYIIDCYENSGNNDSLFAVKALGQDKGQVLFGDGTVDCSINFGEGSYITSTILLCPEGGKTAYPQNTVSNAGMMIKSSTSVITSYTASTIIRVNGSSPTMINLPSSAGTLALTSQIPSTSNFVTTNTSQTISSSKTFNASITLGSTLYTNSSYGNNGYYLMSRGSNSTPTWTKIATAYSLSDIKYAISSNANTTYSGASYGSQTTLSGIYKPKYLSIQGYDSLNSGVTTVDICELYISAKVTPGKWVKITNFPFTAKTATVTPCKSTTSGYGPRLITYISGTTVYVGVDDDDAPNGFYLTLMY